MLYQYDEDCAGDGVIALRRFTRVKGFGDFPGAFSVFWVGSQKGWRLWIGYRAEGIGNWCRVTAVRFSKCSSVIGLCLTQPLDIRHPWLRSRSRQRPVAESLGSV